MCWQRCTRLKAVSRPPQPPPQPCMRSRPAHLLPARILQGPNIAQSITTPQPLLRACIHLQCDAGPDSLVQTRAGTPKQASHRQPQVTGYSDSKLLLHRWRRGLHGVLDQFKRLIRSMEVSNVISDKLSGEGKTPTCPRLDGQRY